MKVWRSGGLSATRTTRGNYLSNRSGLRNCEPDSSMSRYFRWLEPNFRLAKPSLNVIRLPAL